MTLINPVRMEQQIKANAGEVATAPKGKTDAGKSSIAPAAPAVEDTRTWWQWITFAPIPKPVVVAEVKPEPAVWYMVPFNALRNLGHFMGEKLTSLKNVLVSLFHYVTCGCFKGDSKVQVQVEAKKTN